MHRVPKCLILHLKRFQVANNSYQKLTTAVTYPSKACSRPLSYLSQYQSCFDQVAHARGINPSGGTRRFAIGLLEARHQEKRSPVRACVPSSAMHFQHITNSYQKKTTAVTYPSKVGRHHSNTCIDVRGYLGNPGWAWWAEQHNCCSAMLDQASLFGIVGPPQGHSLCTWLSCGVCLDDAWTAWC